jgi:hypothetical protein
VQTPVPDYHDESFEVGVDELGFSSLVIASFGSEDNLIRSLFITEFFDCF